MAEIFDQENTGELHACHRQDLNRLRQMINLLLDKLEEDMKSSVPPDEPHCRFFWGSRESAVSILCKLAQLLIKLLPLELKLSSLEPELPQDELAEEDNAIIQQFIATIQARNAQQPDE